jgi:hypothetical protein
MSALSTSFSPPRQVALSSVVLHGLSPQFADLDYVAVMASANQIRHLFGPTHDWPTADMTYEQNKADLVRHEREFDEQTAFAYALLDLTGAYYLGCVYLEPLATAPPQEQAAHTPIVPYQLKAFIWVSSLYPHTPIEVLMSEINAWLLADFAITAVAWPGRVESWQGWS